MKSYMLTIHKNGCIKICPSKRSSDQYKEYIDSLDTKYTLRDWSHDGVFVIDADDYVSALKAGIDKIESEGLMGWGKCSTGGRSG